ncbi:MAG: bifunctional (p)ppGpp synthetase/guanosine-3',5'-bis(diphosphate) 3'-pyrophosphohydrolase [Sphingomonadaceae bacterium]|nr:bifunctional (p)ppGpp synthetase/guanosine-3',5'-bis(diphosphate) 3'-pyrophosphohydrolase [Sphingomonadaceae bacterium]
MLPNANKMTDAYSIVAAASFAAERHRHQRRKDDAATPYINHPLIVAQFLSMAEVADIDVLVAALLHDTVEDTETTIDEIAEHFGQRVAALVAEVTDDRTLPKAERKRVEVERVAGKSAGARLIKVADKIANLRDIADHPPQWDAARTAAYRQFAADMIARARGLNATLDAMADAELQRAGLA